LRGNEMQSAQSTWDRAPIKVLGHP
jgi:hypothetical protein